MAVPLGSYVAGIISTVLCVFLMSRKLSNVFGRFTLAVFGMFKKVLINNFAFIVICKFQLDYHDIVFDAGDVVPDSTSPGFA